jgi:hypothetical protein
VEPVGFAIPPFGGFAFIVSNIHFLKSSFVIKNAFRQTSQKAFTFLTRLR